MKVTKQLIQVFNLTVRLLPLSKEKLPGLFAIKLRRLMRVITDHASDYEVARNACLESGAVKTEEGEEGFMGYRMNEAGTHFLWQTEEAEKEFTAIAEKEVELEIRPFFDKDFEDDRILIDADTLQLMEVLGVLVTHLEEEK